MGNSTSRFGATTKIRDGACESREEPHLWIYQLKTTSSPGVAYPRTLGCEIEKHGCSRWPISAAITFVTVPSRGALSFCGSTTANQQTDAFFYMDPSFIYFYIPKGETRRAKYEKSNTPSKNTSRIYREHKSRHVHYFSS